MKISIDWLRDWVDVPWEAAELGSRLTMAGFELESLAAAAPPFAGVLVAEIVEAVRHPQADKLQVCTVRSANAGGNADLLQIVCGAPNARAGLRTALAIVGATLPGELKIKAAKLRGVESAGMLCSAKELGLADASEGIIELPADAPIGTELRSYLQLDDAVLELNVTPNRGDAMSVLGIAREVASLAGKALRGPQIVAVADSIADRHEPAIEAPEACGQLVTRVVRGIDNTRPTPLWLRERLRRAGQRSISPIVDVTNYVMLELGQPMHAFDAAKLRGQLRARLARADEPVALLDGRTVELGPDVLVIADDGGPIAMAGVMGGSRTMVEPGTTDIVFEVAWFNPAAVAGRGRRYGLTTDASQRFERGVDPAQQRRAIERATALLTAMAGGKPGPICEKSDSSRLPVRLTVGLRRPQLARLLGIQPADGAVLSVFESLGMQVQTASDGWQITPPGYRFDITIERDLIEEYARITGFDAIPAIDARFAQRIQATPALRPVEGECLQLLAARGYHEAINFAFVDQKLQGALFPDIAALALSNPIASDLGVMRVSLWPGLIRSLQENLRRQQLRVRLCEVGVVFIDGEQQRIAGLAAGSRLPEQWGAQATPVDYFDIRADVEALLATSGAADAFSFVAAPSSCLHPGRSARIMRDQRAVGWIGELHPELVRALDLTYAPMLFELEFAALQRRRAPFQAPSRFPEVRRDLAIVVDESVPFSRIHERVTLAASSLLRDLRVFDEYRGAGVEPGRKSVAIGLIFQDDSRTLADDEADRLVTAIRAELAASLGAKIRE